MASKRQAATEDTGTRALWFTPPDGENNRRRTLTRDSVAAALVALGAYAWAGDRDQRFTAGLDTLISGVRAAQRPGTAT